MDMHAHHHHGSHPPAEPASPKDLKDPVCGMTVTEQSEHKLTHEGRPYYFCSAKCQGKFAANPLQYLVSTAIPCIYCTRGHRARAGRHHLHLPYAPRGAAGSSWNLSQVRHDIGANHSSGRGRQP